MRYLAALPVIVLFALLDVIVIVSIFGMILAAEWPYSWRFAKGVWRL